MNKETNHSCIDSLLTSKCSLDLLHRETQFKNIYRKVYTKVRKANHRSLPYRNKYKLAKTLRVGQKVLLENHQVPFGKSQKLCELRSGPYTVTKVIRKLTTKSRSIRIQRGFKSFIVIISLNSSLVTMIYRLYCPIMKSLSTTTEPNIFTTSMQRIDSPN